MMASDDRIRASSDRLLAFLNLVAANNGSPQQQPWPYKDPSSCSVYGSGNLLNFVCKIAGTTTVPHGALEPGCRIAHCVCRNLDRRLAQFDKESRPPDRGGSVFLTSLLRNLLTGWGALSSVDIMEVWLSAP